MSAMATFAPDSARVRAMTRPIPLPLPVAIAVFPSNRMCTAASFHKIQSLASRRFQTFGRLRAGRGIPSHFPGSDDTTPRPGDQGSGGSLAPVEDKLEGPVPQAPDWARWRHEGGDGVLDLPARLTGFVLEQYGQVLYINPMVPPTSPTRLVGGMLVE